MMDPNVIRNAMAQWNGGGAPRMGPRPQMGPGGAPMGGGSAAPRPPMGGGYQPAPGGSPLAPGASPFAVPYNGPVPVHQGPGAPPPAASGMAGQMFGQLAQNAGPMGGPPPPGLGGFQGAPGNVPMGASSFDPVRRNTMAYPAPQGPMAPMGSPQMQAMQQAQQLAARPSPARGMAAAPMPSSILARMRNQQAMARPTGGGFNPATKFSPM